MSELGPIAYDALDGVPHPARTERILGQSAVFQQFGEGLARGRLHHGWLFSGPRGCGKASSAFLLAKLLLSGRWRGEIFDTPDALLDEGVAAQVSSLSHPDLLYLSRPYDQDRKRFLTVLPVQQIRRINRFFGTTAGAGGWRICIVDAVDDMNASSANALLKNLEEPPEKCLLLLVHHGQRPVLPTIRSRCQMQPFQPLDAPTLRKMMTSILGDPEPAQLDIAVQHAGGSVRAALQLAAGAGAQIAPTLENLALQGGTISVEARARLADKLMGAANEQEFQMFLRLVDQTLHNAAQKAVAEDKRGHPGLAIASEVWDTSRRQIRDTETYNLDRRHLVLSLLRDLERIGQSLTTLS